MREKRALATKSELPEMVTVRILLVFRLLIQP